MNNLLLWVSYPKVSLPILLLSLMQREENQRGILSGCRANTYVHFSVKTVIMETREVILTS